MKQKEIQIKTAAFVLAEGIQLVAETTRYWFRRVQRTTKVLVTDAFTLNVKGGISDFQWEEGELEAEPGIVEVAEKKIRHERIRKGHVKRFLLRNLKRTLRFLILDIPEWFSRNRQMPETVDPFANRIRR